jgi:hypothetical protein
MAVEYVDRSAWRNRGRPRKPADPELVRVLRRTYDTGTVARLPIEDGETADAVRELLTQLGRAAHELGLRLRVQPRRSVQILAAHEVKFYAEEED